jgi:hypothetical protein
MTYNVFEKKERAAIVIEERRPGLRNMHSL